MRIYFLFILAAIYSLTSVSQVQNKKDLYVKLGIKQLNLYRLDSLGNKIITDTKFLNEQGLIYKEVSLFWNGETYDTTYLSLYEFDSIGYLTRNRLYYKDELQIDIWFIKIDSNSYKSITVRKGKTFETIYKTKVKKKNEKVVIRYYADGRLVGKSVLNNKNNIVKYKGKKRKYGFLKRSTHVQFIEDDHQRVTRRYYRSYWFKNCKKYSDITEYAYFEDGLLLKACTDYPSCVGNDDGCVYYEYIK